MKGVPVIGDSERDLTAAHAVDARPILVLTGNGRKTKAELERKGIGIECHEDLLSAARALVGESGRTR